MHRNSHDQELQDLYDQVLSGFGNGEDDGPVVTPTIPTPRDAFPPHAMSSRSAYPNYEQRNGNTRAQPIVSRTTRQQPTPTPSTSSSVSPTTPRKSPRPLPTLPPGAAMPLPTSYKPFPDEKKEGFQFDPAISGMSSNGGGNVGQGIRRLPQQPPMPATPSDAGYSDPYSGTMSSTSSSFPASPLDPVLSGRHDLPLPSNKFNGQNHMNGRYGSPSHSQSPPETARPGASMPAPYRQVQAPVARGDYFDEMPGYRAGSSSSSQQYNQQNTQKSYNNTWVDPNDDNGSETDLSRSNSQSLSFTSTSSSSEPTNLTSYPDSLYSNKNGVMSSSRSSLSQDSTDGTIIGGQTRSASAIPPPMRSEIMRSSSSQAYPSASSNPSAGPSSRRAEYENLVDMKRQPLELHEESDDGFFDEDTDDENDDRYVNLALVSHLAVKLRDKVPRGTHVKGSIPYPRAFTGKDIVTTIQSQIQRELLKTMNISTTDRSVAVAIARSLQGQLFFYEVEWGGKALTDGVEDVFMFLDDQESMSDAMPERSELPTGVVTFLTKCYSSSCQDETPCYSWACPKRKSTLQRSAGSVNVAVPKAMKEQDAGWASGISQEILDSLPPSEIKRQTIIHKIVKKEEQYVEDLDLIERLFLRPLRMANPPVIARDDIEDFVEAVFANVLDLRECNKRLLEVMYVRQREQGPIIQRIGDVFLTAAAEFRLAYPAYVGHLPVAEKRLKDEMENNGEFKRFLEQCSRQTEARKLDLKHFLTRPSEHLQKYPVLLEAVMQETSEGNPDVDYLNEAIQSIKNLYTVATLRTFQNAMGKGPTSKLQWFDLVTKEQMPGITKHEAKRQSIMWELIQGEMAYVRDLELIDTIFIRPLWTASPPIIPRERLKGFLQDVFHNYLDILRPQRELLNQLHEIQREEHPTIRSITAPVFNAALNWTDAYMEYIPHHPIATYRVDDEMAKNPAFKKFIEQCTRHPEARKLDIKSFIMRPVARLLRYPLLLQGVMDAAPAAHEDKETIPQVLEVIKDLGKAADGGVETAKQKVELWRYDANLVFKTGEQIDLDLQAETRSLVHTGKLLRQPEGTIDISGWTELFVMLFDNYLVMSKPRERDGVVKYHVNKRPIPLELLSLASFSDPPQLKGTAFLKTFARDKSLTSSSVSAVPNGESPGDSRSVYPLTVHHNGRMGGLYTLYAETQDARAEWKTKLEEALSLRSVIQDSNKVFEIEPLSSDTFFMPAIHGANAPAWNNDTPMTGRVTCSVPFSTQDGRGLVAIGCAEGVWIGLRHDSKSLKRVLHLKNVTQCAMLEDFGIFLVLAEKALFAYHIEALVPSGPTSMHATTAPQRLNGSSNVQFFTVGQLHGRTLIIYMKKKSMDSVFRMLEPVAGKINEKVKNPGALARMGIGSQKSDWFRTYREFFLPSEAFDVIFLKAKLVILCSKGFEIMDLGEFKSETIPRRDDPRISHVVKRLESCKPLGMYRSTGDEFLLCYNEFGLYVDRHGETSRAQNEVVVEWEGTAEHVAFHPPYLLLFDLRFIEVRHIETGRLAQIIPGNEVRLTWDGRGSSSAPPVQTPGPDGWQESTYQEPRVHGVMKASEPPMGMNRQRPVVQQVFELVPTIPLYLPGSLQSPNTSSFFPPPSPTPTHSPNPSMSYGPWPR